MTHDEFAVSVYDAVTYLLETTVTEERVRDTIRHLDIGEDVLVLQSPAEIKVQLVWNDLIQWLEDEGSLRDEYPLDLVDGLCGAQAHTWIAIRNAEHDFDRDPVEPVFILDVVPPLTIPAPIMIGPGSPLRLCYKKRTVKG